MSARASPRGVFRDPPGRSTLGTEGFIGGAVEGFSLTFECCDRRCVDGRGESEVEAMASKTSTGERSSDGRRDLLETGDR